MPQWAWMCLGFLSPRRRRGGGGGGGVGGVGGAGGGGGSAFPRLPSPQATVSARDVPVLFREPYIHAGYRPVGQPLVCYLLSLFQVHNETVNVWSHLLTGVAVLLRFLFRLHTWESEAEPLDLTALPLCLYLSSALAYLSCSAAAHLCQSHSELAHYCLFFLDYVGVSVYQYGCALAHYVYSSEPAWRDSTVGAHFLPAAIFLAWLTCASCCYAKMRYQRPYPLRRKLFQLVPTSLAYLLDVSPVAHRLASANNGSPTDADVAGDPALTLHALQIGFFLLAALFFSCPLPECLLPGRCDIVGHGHQVFHLFLALCTLVQQEALMRDYVWRRRALEKLHGRDTLLMACLSFPTLVICSSLTAWAMALRVKRRLRARPK